MLIWTRKRARMYCVFVCVLHVCVEVWMCLCVCVHTNMCVSVTHLCVSVSVCLCVGVCIMYLSGWDPEGSNNIATLR